MIGTRAAIRYAKAVLSLASDNQKAEAVQLDMTLIGQAIASNASLENALKSPVVKLSEKAAVLDALFPSVSSESKSLFRTLVTNKRVNILGQIALQYGILYDKLNNKENAFVTTAIPMTSELEVKVIAKLKTLTTKEVTLNKSVDKNLLGGFVLRVGDQQYDASVSNQLNALKSKFTIN
jgi:F-type H+-transporting ATPase subunit delta|tara:strand:- start:8497 stop:9033 length:537 start_codon:yes stop_codon:yes gene_type:complete